MNKILLFILLLISNKISAFLDLSNTNCSFPVNKIYTQKNFNEITTCIVQEINSKINEAIIRNDTNLIYKLVMFGNSTIDSCINENLFPVNTIYTQDIIDEIKICMANPIFGVYTLDIRNEINEAIARNTFSPKHDCDSMYSDIAKINNQYLLDGIYLDAGFCYNKGLFRKLDVPFESESDKSPLLLAIFLLILPIPLVFVR